MRCVAGEDFRAVSLRIMKDGTPSADDNLLGMEMDFFLLLGDLQELDGESVQVRATRSAECLIRATCRAAPGVSLDRAAEAVRDLWVSNLSYSHFEAHELAVAEGEATLHFVTQMRTHGLYVTGQVGITPSGQA
jgi:hypothetical protein